MCSISYTSSVCVHTCTFVAHASHIRSRVLICWLNSESDSSQRLALQRLSPTAVEAILDAALRSSANLPPMPMTMHTEGIQIPDWLSEVIYQKVQAIIDTAAKSLERTAAWEEVQDLLVRSRLVLKNVKLPVSQVGSTPTTAAASGRAAPRPRNMARMCSPKVSRGKSHRTLHASIARHRRWMRNTRPSTVPCATSRKASFHL